MHVRHQQSSGRHRKSFDGISGFTGYGVDGTHPQLRHVFHVGHRLDLRVQFGGKQVSPEGPPVAVACTVNRVDVPVELFLDRPLDLVDVGSSSNLYPSVHGSENVLGL